MQILSTAIPDIVLLAPTVYRDDRGYFLESYNRRTLASLGIQIDFTQDSASFSRRGTLRGLHFQKENTLKPNSCVRYAVAFWM